jgi:transcriptional regulator of aromatic amino acid metabolism
MKLPTDRRIQRRFTKISFFGVAFAIWLAYLALRLPGLIVLLIFCDEAVYFMQKESPEIGLAGIAILTTGATDSLISYHRRGNVQELENAVEHALILRGGRPLIFPDLQVTVAGEAR